MRRPSPAAGALFMTLLLAACAQGGWRTATAPPVASGTDTPTLAAVDREADVAADTVVLAWLLPPTAPGAQRVWDGLAFVVAADSGWDIETLRRFADSLPRRLAECGVALTPVPVVRDESLPAVWTEATRRPPESGARIAFVERIELAGDDTVQGRTLGALDPPTALIARVDAHGAVLEARQTVAHEAGHMLGLGHSGRPGLDLMAARDACAKCLFSAAQCRIIRRSPLLRDGKDAPN